MTKEKALRSFRIWFENRTGSFWIADFEETEESWNNGTLSDTALMSMEFGEGYNLTLALEWNKRAGEFVIRSLYLNGDERLINTTEKGISREDVLERLHGYMDILEVQGKTSA